MNRIDRLFAILTFLQSKKYVPAEKIADKFGISIRTVYRDVKALCESGIPVSFEPAKGYFIVQGYFLSPVSFSTEEANALVMMETLAYGFADKSIQQHYTAALNKVKSVLRGTQKEKLEILDKNIRMQVPSCLSYNAGYLSSIQTAIINRHILDIEYANKNSEQGWRSVEPIGLIFYALNWHLIAWCHKRNEYRDFRVSRIQDMKVTDTPFRIDKHMEINEYMQQLPVSY